MGKTLWHALGTAWCRFPTLPWYLLLLVPLPVVWWILQAPHLFALEQAVRPLFLLYSLALLIYLFGLWLLRTAHRAAVFTLMVLLTEPATSFLLDHAHTLYLFIGTMGPIALPSLSWAALLILLLAVWGGVLLWDKRLRYWSPIMLGSAVITAVLMVWDPLWAATFLIGTVWGYLMVRPQWGPAVTVVLNGVVVMFWMALFSQWLPWPQLQQLRAFKQQLQGVGAVQNQPFKHDAAPVIVQIQLQGYPRADVLQANAYGKNVAFQQGLSKAGFRIIEDSLMNHPQPDMALWAMWGMETKLFEQVLEQPLSHTWLQWLVKEEMAQRPWLHFIKSQGYRTYYMDAQQQAPYLSHMGENLHITTNPVLNPLEQQLLRAIPWPALHQRIEKVQHIQSQRLLHQALSYRYTNLPQDKRPLFVMEHLALPKLMVENPYGDGLWRAHQRMRFMMALKGFNGAVLAKVEALKKLFAHRPLIIIIHGGAMHEGVKLGKKRCLEHRFAPLLALYSSTGGWSDLPVEGGHMANLYQLVMQHWFNQPNGQAAARFYDQDQDAPDHLQRIPLWRLRGSCDQRQGLWTWEPWRPAILPWDGRAAAGA
ncbi:hypothetical protein [Magnetococcus sp. PR-3]|uniref:hypothetical protein n=1 Tax=Magnetococcus sp. PR-3 TaxID=3120355 RepID=UPI002FCE151D